MSHLPPRAALLAFVVWLTGGLLLGECWPFSRYSMYADIADREQGALPLFWANGQPAEPEQFSSFYGVDPSAFNGPEGIPTTFDYLTRPRAQWVSTHPAAHPGPVRIEVGWELVKMGPHGLERSPMILSTGSAWP